nr:hypothetical protein [Rhodobacter xanthinilyticus]
MALDHITLDLGGVTGPHRLGDAALHLERLQRVIVDYLCRDGKAVGAQHIDPGLAAAAIGILDDKDRDRLGGGKGRGGKKPAARARI